MTKTLKIKVFRIIKCLNMKNYVFNMKKLNFIKKKRKKNLDECKVNLMEQILNILLVIWAMTKS